MKSLSVSFCPALRYTKTKNTPAQVGNVRVNYFYQPPGLNNLTPEDPRWIGNWWIGFLVCAGLLSVISVILLGFPTHFQTDKRKLEKKIQNSAKRSKLHTFLTRFKEFLVAGKELMLNPVFVCHCLAVNIPRFVVDGTSPFAVKILLAKYGISATKVGLALAASGAPGIIRKK